MVLPVGLCLLLSVVLQNLSQMNKPLLSEKQIISTALLEKRDGTGEVIIKRDSGFFGSACFSRVYVDGKEVADLGTAQKVIHATIGDHVFSAWPKRVCGGGMSEQASKVTTDRTDVSHRVWIKR